MSMTKPRPALGSCRRAQAVRLPAHARHLAAELPQGNRPRERRGGHRRRGHVHADGVRRDAVRRRRAGRALAARRLRRAERDRPRGCGRLRRLRDPATQHQDPVGTADPAHAPVRDAPGHGAAQAVLGCADLRGRARGGHGPAEPLALRRDGGDGTGRARQLAADRVDRPRPRTARAGDGLPGHPDGVEHRRLRVPRTQSGARDVGYRLVQSRRGLGRHRACQVGRRLARVECRRAGRGERAFDHRAGRDRDRRRAAGRRLHPRAQRGVSIHGARRRVVQHRAAHQESHRSAGRRGGLRRLGHARRTWAR